MFGKILLFICFMGVSQAVFIDPAENHSKDFKKENPHGWQMIQVYHPPNSQAFGYKYEPYAYPKYEFEYSVSDKKTGDHKHHHEARDGDRVRGEYSLVQSDGSLRKVQYNADDHNGFNAVVSKTVNKHGDHAFSVTDHTRFFYPVGHGIKINHFFPGNDYRYQQIENLEDNKESIPVHEEKESSVAKNEEPKILLIDSGDKNMLVESEQGKEEAPKPEIEGVETVSLKVVPAVVSMVQENSDINNNVENLSADDENTETTPSNESPIAEDQKIEKEDQQPDSEVASSYYQSKIYYYAF